MVLPATSISEARTCPTKPARDSIADLYGLLFSLAEWIGRQLVFATAWTVTDRGARMWNATVVDSIPSPANRQRSKFLGKIY